MSNKALPTHINVNYIEKALCKAFPNKQLTLLNCEIQLSDKNGENFCSNIFKVFVRYKFEDNNGTATEKCLIVKDMLMEISDVGTNEWDMYEKVLPEMERILAKDVKEQAILKPR